jgi:hypothetical protein
VARRQWDRCRSLGAQITEHSAERVVVVNTRGPVSGTASIYEARSSGET